MARNVYLALILVFLLPFGLSAESWSAPETLHPSTSYFVPRRTSPPGPINNLQQVPKGNMHLYPSNTFQLYLLPVYLPPDIELRSPFQYNLSPLQSTGKLPAYLPFLGSYPNTFPAPESRPFQREPLPLQATNRFPENRPFRGPYPVPYPIAESRPVFQPEQRPLQGSVPENRPFHGPYPVPYPVAESRPLFQPEQRPLQGRVPENRPFRGPYPDPFPPARSRPFLHLKPRTMQGSNQFLQNRPFRGPYPNSFPSAEPRPFPQLKPLPLQDRELSKNNPLLGSSPPSFPAFEYPPFPQHQPHPSMGTDQRSKIRPFINPNPFPTATELPPEQNADEQPEQNVAGSVASSEQPSHVPSEPNLVRDVTEPPELPLNPETDLGTQPPLFAQGGQEFPSFSDEISAKRSAQKSGPLELNESSPSVGDVSIDATQPRAPTDPPSSEDDGRVLIDTWKTPACPDGQKRDHAGRCRDVSL